MEVHLSRFVREENLSLFDAEIGYRKFERRFARLLPGRLFRLVGRLHDVPVSLAVGKHAGVDFGRCEDDFRHLETLAEYREQIDDHRDSRRSDEPVALERTVACHDEILQIERCLREEAEQRDVEFRKIDRRLDHFVSLLFHNVADFAAQGNRNDNHQGDDCDNQSARNFKQSLHLSLCFMW